MLIEVAFPAARADTNEAHDPAPRLVRPSSVADRDGPTRVFGSSSKSHARKRLRLLLIVHLPSAGRHRVEALTEGERSSGAAAHRAKRNGHRLSRGSTAAPRAGVIVDRMSRLDESEVPEYAPRWGPPARAASESSDAPSDETATGGRAVGALAVRQFWRREARDLEEAGKLREAEQAWLRGRDVGDAICASHLAHLLWRRGALSEAEAAFRVADELGYPAAPLGLGSMLERRGRIGDAEEEYARAGRGDFLVGFLHQGYLLSHAGEVAAAEAAYASAAAGGIAAGDFHLGRMLHDRGDDDAAEKAFRRAADAGDSDARDYLKRWLKRRQR